MEKAKILVIVVVYNGMRWLEKSLSSVTASSIPADLFIVDNGSTDGSIEYIKSTFPQATLHISQTNLCFGRGNNLGLRHALDKGYDYVYLLNQDAWVEPDTFEKLIGISQNYPEFGILSPLQTNASGDSLDKNFAMCIPPDYSSDAICGVVKQVYEVKFVMAAHWLITINCLRQTGGFSPTFPHYGEDNNYIDRVLYNNLKVGIVTSAKGVHDREFRAVTNEHIQYTEYIKILVYLSNPRIPLNMIARIKLLFKAGFQMFPFPNIYSRTIFRNFFTIMRNKQKSLGICPFI